jgi:hypothetical protein
MIEVMKLIKQAKTSEITSQLNSPLIHQRVLKSIHQISKEEITRTATTLRLFNEHLNAKKQAKHIEDITPIYLVF